MIMAQISLRIDDVKVNAEKVCKDIGISMSTAVNIYLKGLGQRDEYHLKCRRILFTVKRIWINWRGELPIFAQEKVC